MDKEGKLSLQELISDYIEAYQDGKISKEEYEEAIKKYESDNNRRVPDYAFKQKKYRRQNEIGWKMFVSGTIVVSIIVVALIVLGIVKFGAAIFSDNDYDNDGLSNDFEVEQGTDAHDYTWNFEWNN